MNHDTASNMLLKPSAIGGIVRSDAMIDVVQNNSDYGRIVKATLKSNVAPV
jgi:hypothetical protein